MLDFTKISVNLFDFCLSRLWEFLSKNYMNPNASSDVENATGDRNATGKKRVKNNLDNPQLIIIILIVFLIYVIFH